MKSQWHSSQAMELTRLLIGCLFLATNMAVNDAEEKVDSVSTHEGSCAGGTQMRISGKGFSEDQFAFDDPTLGNRVVFKASNGHSLDCKVEPTLTSTELIVCEITGIPVEKIKYYLKITKDGQAFGADENGNVVSKTYCDSSSGCSFKCTDGKTPTIEKFNRQSGVPSDMVLNVTGDIQTSQIGRLSDGNGLTFQPDSTEITRVYVGGANCDTNDEHGDGLGIHFNETTKKGWFRCKPMVKSGSYKVTFLNSKYGRSKADEELYIVDGNDQIYDFQAHSGVYSVEPKNGSRAGGLIITIRGTCFGNNINNTRVTVGGFHCDVLSVNDTTITCRTPQENSENNNRTAYPGGRGVVREIWMNTVLYDMTTLEDELDEETSEYTRETFTQYGSFLRDDVTKPLSTRYVGRVTGFFVPPQTDCYKFHVSSDDKSLVLLSNDSSPEHKREVASAVWYTGTNWYKYSSQKSESLCLERGRAYYLDGRYSDYGGGHFLKIGLHKDRTELMNSDVHVAKHEEQQIYIRSIRDKEIQTICVGNWTNTASNYEEQIVCVDQQASTFALSYDGDPTTSMSTTISASDLAVALNYLPSINGAAQVTLINANSTHRCYRVIFEFSQPEKTFELREVVQASQSSYVTVTTQKPGTSSGEMYRLSFGGKRSLPIYKDSTEEEIMDSIRPLFTTECEYLHNPSVSYFSQDYDNPRNGWEVGSRVTDEEAYCGRRSSFYNHVPFYYWHTRTSDGRTVNEANIEDNPQFCFALKGENPKANFTFYVKFTSNGRNTHRYTNYTTQSTSQWKYECVNLWEHFTQSSTIADEVDSNHPVYIRVIYLDPRTLFLDDLWIGPSEQQVTKRRKPNGHWIDEYSVDKIEDSDCWKLKVHPNSCGVNVPLVGIVGAHPTGSDEDDKEVRVVDTDTTFTVTREQAATPGITGVFDLYFQNATIQDIPLSTNAHEMEDLLAEHFNLGDVRVSLANRQYCYKYRWYMHWDERPGKQPEIHVNGSKLSGHDFIAKNIIKDGGLFYEQIPGEFLRVPCNEPQVVVSVNDLVATCSCGDCSFQHTNDRTPVVTGLSPTAGDTDTLFTISGTGFGNNINDSSVALGGVLCRMQSITDNQIMFYMNDDTPPGSQPLRVNIANKGNAVFQVQQNKRRRRRRSLNSLDLNALTIDRLVIVTSMSPVTCGTAGGVVVTINGNGFGTTISLIQVTIGQAPCQVTHVSTRRIECITGANPAGVVDVVVSSESFNPSKTLNSYFTYDASLQPQITSMVPDNGPVTGGISVTLTGTGFPSTADEVTVTMGGQTCQIDSVTEATITFLVPVNPPGPVPVILDTTHNGRASYNGIPGDFNTVLQVTGVSPKRGSLNGGSIVTIDGEGFHTDPALNSVMLGRKECVIVESTPTQLRCRTPYGGGTYDVDNSGAHPEYGIGYAWSPATITIRVGEAIKWSWGVPEGVNLEFEVHQTSDDVSVQYDMTGFRSERGPSGTYTHRFSRAGTYYYSSGYIDSSETIDMKGTIIVEPPLSSVVNVNVKVNGFDASHDLGSATVSNVNDNCGEQAATTADGIHYSFTFSTCITAIVNSVEPSTGRSTAQIKLHGTGFSTNNLENNIMFGGHACQVQSSTTTLVTCTLDTSSNPPPFVSLPVSVIVVGVGRALVAPGHNQITSFTLIPSINSIQPTTGSVMGGTKLTLIGAGFVNGTEIALGNNLCEILTMTYTTIECASPTSSDTLSNTVVVNVSIAMETSDGSVLQGDCMASPCEYTYSRLQTPEVTALQPTTVDAPDTVLTFTGSKFTDVTSDVRVMVGSEPCVVTSSSQSEITCSVAGLVMGVHDVVITIAGNKGRVSFTDPSMQQVTSEGTVTSVTPSQGSVNGGLLMTLIGNGFEPAVTTVMIGSSSCSISEITTSMIKCHTPPQEEGSFLVRVTSDEETLGTSLLFYATSSASTPVISSVTQSSGRTGDTITLQGSYFATDSSQNNVQIARTDCMVTSSTATSIACTLAAKPSGTYPVHLHVTGKGIATSGHTFTYELNIDNITPTESGFGGGKLITLTGSGFSSTARVKICGNPCIIAKDYSVTDSTIECEVPPKTQSAPGADDQCSLTIDSPEASDSTIQATLPSAYTYKDALTSTITAVSPPRGGTGGGVRLTISGSGFSTTQNNNLVTIDGTSCLVVSATSIEIQCITGQHNRTIKTKVRVEVGTNGAAVQQSADFYYVDVWSSRYTWGGRDPPVEGDFVVIDKGQTMVLDVDTPCLAFLLIKGGTFIFDDEQDIHLQSKFILITHGGSFMIGTEEAPFQHKATVTIHGHVRSKEIPVYGAKSIALREGYLGLHGKHVLHTWTVIMETVNPGDNALKLKHAVTWQPGDKIVIAPTGKDLREHEEVTIVGVQQGGRLIMVLPPLKYKHICIVQRIAGRVIETCAEVGLLTRNVVIQGSQHDQWSGTIKACFKAFEPGQFQTQTCFLGKFGQEPGSDEFGVQIMIHNPVKSAGRITAHFDHIEVRHAGQSFRIGRYPIHFHVTGDVHGSYVKGCSIHHTFNRAVTMHGVNYLVVERNVFYHTRGNSFFMEDGIEIANTVRYNLGIFVTSSTSTLNVDITPAAYWVTNANNTVTDNVAAGGSHFGFWYQMFEHPDGPSFTPEVCPRNVPMAPNGFRNNTAHTFGRYGLWVFPTYHPKVGGHCESQTPEPAEFHSLLSWHNMRGAEGVEMGAVRFVDFIMMDNDLAGIEYIEAASAGAPWGVSMIKDSLVVGRSMLTEDLPPLTKTNKNCTETGLMLPKTSKLTVSNVTLVNFYHEQCVAMEACAHCKPRQGGWTVKFDNIILTNVTRRARFKWPHEVVFRDLDGSITGTAGASIVPTNPNLPPSACSVSAIDSFGAVSGSICDSSIDFRRFAWNKALPDSLNPQDALLTNAHGTDAITWQMKRLTHGNGWMATVITGMDYQLAFRNHSHLTNITYNGGFYEFNENDYIRMTHILGQEPDFAKTTEHVQNFSDVIPQITDRHGQWGFVNRTKGLTYLVSGKNNTRDINNNIARKNINLRIYRCYFLKCTPPAPPMLFDVPPTLSLKWSIKADWNRPGAPTEFGYGGYNGTLPQENDTVMIRPEWRMELDTTTPVLDRVYIYGILELDRTRNHVFCASIIFIRGLYAQLIIGTEDEPFPNNVLISLRGDHDSKDMPLNDGPNVGSKAIGVFGRLELHGKPCAVYWTHLSMNANIGDTSITLKDDVGTGNCWQVGDEIVIASTTYEPRQAERRKITNVNQNVVTLETALQYKHISHTHTLPNGQSYQFAAEVGLLTRNIKIEGEDGPAGAISSQDFGCRVIVGRTSANNVEYVGRAKIENVEFKNCGQKGWSDFYDPRYSLAFLDVGTTSTNDSYVKGNAFNYNFNSALGVFGTNNLLVEDNVVYFTLGASIRIWGEMNRAVHNLVVYSASLATYKTLLFSLHWPGAIETESAISPILIDNAIGGSELIGYLTDGEPCDIENSSPGKWRGNTVHGALQGISIMYKQGLFGCAKISGFQVWKSYDWGFFAFTQSRIIVQDVVFAENTNSINAHIYRPKALTHKAADKFLHVERSTFIGRTSSWDCSADNVVPVSTVVNEKHRAKRPPGGGMAGMLFPSFQSIKAGGPKMRWDNPTSYPAIYGTTKLINVTFDSFGAACGARDIAIMPNTAVGDIMHPMEVEGIQKYNVEDESLMYFSVPTTQWINPSDCVDMDCDSLRQLLITDKDGSFSGQAGNTLISKAEYQWGGNPSFGLGDYRIPTTAQTAPDGTRLNVSIIFPHKGIIRGTKDTSQCTWKDMWNAYMCSNMDHHMAILESLDADTETRRLSPVAIMGDGYVNLLNGPMDHGWCLGYTCQERISTFYGIVAANRNYSVHFSSTNPQKMRLHLLAEREKAVRFGIHYKTNKRLDIYRRGLYISPTNAELSGTDFTLKRKDPSLPDDQFEPQLTTFSGANYFDREAKILYIIVRGSQPIDIRTTPVIQVSIGLTVTEDDFFEENLVQNLAALLGIDSSRIRVMNVVSAGGARKRRSTDGSSTVQAEVEIGDPPETTIEYETVETYDNSTALDNSTIEDEGGVSQNYTGVENATTFSDLEEIAANLVNQVQTGALGESMNATVEQLVVTEPEPEPVDTTGGERASNETVQSNGTSDDTMLYGQLTEQESDNDGGGTTYTIPKHLRLLIEPSDGNETVPLPSYPVLIMHDYANNMVSNLGLGEDGAWEVTGVIRAGTGDPSATLLGNTTAKFYNGMANFSSMSISHSGSYQLDFHISKPNTTSFTVSSQLFNIIEREVYFTIGSQPGNGVEFAPLSQQPTVEARDAATGGLIDNTGWRGRTWLATASLANPGNNAQLSGTTTVQFSNGVATFTDLSVDITASNYRLNIDCSTDPVSNYAGQTTTTTFDVTDRQMYLSVAQQPGDCNDTVACVIPPIIEVYDSYSNAVLNNLGWRNRTWFIQASTPNATQLVGDTRLQVPSSGQLEFTSLGFNDVGSKFVVLFTLETKPSSNYNSVTVWSAGVDVASREFYLFVSNVDISIDLNEPFSVTVEVRDAATGVKATSLAGQWTMDVTLVANPTGATFTGTHTVAVVDAEATFVDLQLDQIGTGYMLEITSNYSHLVQYGPFEVIQPNMYAAEFNPSQYTSSLLEDVDVGTMVANVTATDQDVGIYGRVYYSISNGNDENKFTIDNTTGVVETAGELDRETTSSYNITIMAFDGSAPPRTLYSYATLIVEVLDVNDNSPILATGNQTVVIRQNRTVGDEIITLTASDADEGNNGKVQYLLVYGNNMGWFSLDANTGVITLNASIDLDQLNRDNYTETLKVEARDNGSTPRASDPATITIIVVNVNDNNPVFTTPPPLNIDVPEDTPSDYVITQVSATDADHDAVIVYSITGGNERGFFKIDSTTGKIKVMTSLDLETVVHASGLSYTLTIQAADQGNPTQTATASFTITVTPVNEFSPVFSENSHSLCVLENATIDTQIYTANASDEDYGTDGVVQYSITAGNDDSYFKIDQSSGVVSVAQALSHTATPYGINFTITVTDLASNAGSRRTSAMELHICIEDVNDNPPVFTTSIPNTNVAEDASVGFVIQQAQATDADHGLNAAITYSIIAGNERGFFEIDPTTGEIKVKTSLDLETVVHASGLSYTLTIQAADQGNPSQTATTSFTITVTPVNEFPPVFSENSHSLCVPENATIDTQIYTANANDQDYGTDGDVQYSITAGNDDSYFKIEQSSGVISVAQALSHTATPYGINLTITVTDLASNAGSRRTSTMELHICIEDVNDNPPVFTTSIPNTNVAEDASVGFVIQQAQATDADHGLNAAITYSIIAGNERGFFEIDSTTGEIKVKTSLDLETVVHASGLSYTLTIQAADQGNPSQTATTSFTITVTPVNEFSPVFSENSHSLCILENATIDTQIYTANANDQDYGTDGDVQYSITAGNNDGYFEIDQSSGVISVAQALSHTATPYGINLTITVTDLASNVGSRRTSTMELHVCIEDVNDNPPVFTTSISNTNVAEDALVGFVIQQTQATDADHGLNAAITYSITAGNEQGFFEIDSTTGEIKVKTSLDLETIVHASGLSYTLTIQAADQGSPPQTATTSFTLIVTPVNEFSPVFSENSHSLCVPENATIDTQIYTANASDEDYGTDGDVQYSITAGNDDGYFKIDQSSGVVSVAQQLNYLSTPSTINLTITVTDLASDVGSRRTTTMKVYICIEDVNEHKPIFTAPLPNTNVPEDAPLEHLIQQAQATDADHRNNTGLTYSIIDGNDRNLFDIDPTTGKITVRTSLDLETVDHDSDLIYTLTIQAADQGSPPQTATAPLIITITLVNEFSPVFNENSHSLCILENATIDTQIYTANASDQDYGTDGDVQYSIAAGNDDSYFKIDQSSGVISVAQALSHTATPYGINLTITVTDLASNVGSRRTSTMELHICIEDVNDNPPVFTTSIPNTNVAEDASVGFVIQQAQATDADHGLNAAITYSIIAGNERGFFEIDPTTGEIKVKTSLDLETVVHASGLSYTLTIQAADQGNPSQTATTSFTITVTPVNEFPPVFSENSHSLCVPENATIDTQIYTANANDQDYGTDGDVQYSITAGNDDSYFKIEQSSGVISVAQALSHTATPYGINLTITVTDLASNAGSRRTSTMELHICIEDVNDNPPVFTTSIPNTNVAEDASVGFVIQQAQATDADHGLNAAITYSIIAGNERGFFEIDPTTGEIKVKTSLDLETVVHANGLSYTLTIQAADQGNPSQTATTSFTITVTPVNEFPPVFSENSHSLCVPENATIDTQIYTANANDQDYGTDGDLQYSITAGNDDSYFKIDQSSGVISVSQQLNYLSTPSTINLTITVTDLASDVGSRRTTTMKVYICIEDVNEHKPIFTAPLPNTNVLENAPLEHLIQQAQATDADHSSNTGITYSIINGNTRDLFKIDSITGEVKVKSSLDLETVTHDNGLTYTLTIQAADQGSPPHTATTPLTITVTSVNEFSPVFSETSHTLTLSDDDAIDTQIYTATASDEDYGTDGVVRYSITAGNNGGYFRIDEITGVVSIANKLAATNSPGIVLTITATDLATDVASRRTSTMELRIDVEGINRNDPVFASVPATVNVPETATINDVVYQVQATDADEGVNGAIAYIITAGNSRDFFKIDSSTGEIKAKNSLDMETVTHDENALYKLTVEARDHGSTPRTATVNVTIQVTEVNEFTPVFQESGTMISLNEDSAVGSVVGNVKATDADHGEDGRISYSIISGNGIDYFSVDATTGAVTLTQHLNYEVEKKYVLGIKAEDHASPGSRKSAQAELTITVVFVPSSEGDDPQQLTDEIQLTYPDVDYDTTVVGNEDAIISSVNNSLTAQNPGAIFIHFQLSKGSLIVTFEMITQQSKTSNVLNNIASGVIITDNDGQTYKTDGNLKVDNQVFETTENSSEEAQTMLPVIIGTVAGALVLLGVGIAILIACHSTRNERKAARGYPPEHYMPPARPNSRSRSVPVLPQHGFHRSHSEPVLPHIYSNAALRMPEHPSRRTRPPAGRRSMDSNHDLLRDVVTSEPYAAFRGKSPTDFRPPSSLSSSRYAHLARPPVAPKSSSSNQPQSGSYHSSGYAASFPNTPSSAKFNPVFDESLITSPPRSVTSGSHYSDPVNRMMNVNLLNPREGGVFNKLGCIDVNTQATLCELRANLDRQLGVELQGKRFVFVNHDFKMVSRHEEDRTAVNAIFKTNVKIQLI